MAAAHITDCQSSSAPAGSRRHLAARAARVRRGPTTSLSVKMPDGVSWSPQAVPGWAAKAVEGSSRSAGPGGRRDDHRGRHAGDVDGRAAPAARVHRLRPQYEAPEQARQTLHFPVIQRCSGGKVTRWITIVPPAPRSGDARAGRGADHRDGRRRRFDVDLGTASRPPPAAEATPPEARRRRVPTARTSACPRHRRARRRARRAGPRPERAAPPRGSAPRHARRSSQQWERC